MRELEERGEVNLTSHRCGTYTVTDAGGGRVDPMELRLGHPEVEVDSAVGGDERCRMAGDQPRRRHLLRDYAVHGGVHAARVLQVEIRVFLRQVVGGLELFLLHLLHLLHLLLVMEMMEMVVLLRSGRLGEGSGGGGVVEGGDGDAVVAAGEGVGGVDVGVAGDAEGGGTSQSQTRAWREASLLAPWTLASQPPHRKAASARQKSIAGDPLQKSHSLAPITPQ
ncbi:unnamed protein product [Spirodela intermedia]|uniref:Uncharacterized protein n=1 Tax=Spirodela intermedia TaxID=51605 RepID=A0A7I8LB93_SPIIN|nr:unnamed protein product [Spirodela intermedia]